MRILSGDLGGHARTAGDSEGWQQQPVPCGRDCRRGQASSLILIVTGAPGTLVESLGRASIPKALARFMLSSIPFSIRSSPWVQGRGTETMACHPQPLIDSTTTGPSGMRLGSAFAAKIDGLLNRSDLACSGNQGVHSQGAQTGSRASLSWSFGVCLRAKNTALIPRGKERRAKVSSRRGG